MNIDTWYRVNQWHVDGHVMCCICFKTRVKKELYRDSEGTIWDICLQCREEEYVMLEKEDDK